MNIVQKNIKVIAALAMAVLPVISALGVPCEVCTHEGYKYNDWVKLDDGYYYRTVYYGMALCEGTYDSLQCLTNQGTYMVTEMFQRKKGLDGSTEILSYDDIENNNDCSSDDGTGCH